MPLAVVRAMARAELAEKEAELAALAERYAIPAVYTDYREMIETERPDFVDVITPPETHREMCRFAAEAGVHVICQKPLALELAEARRIVDRADELGRRVAVQQQMRYEEGMRAAHAMIENHDLRCKIASTITKINMQAIKTAGTA